MKIETEEYLSSKDKTWHFRIIEENGRNTEYIYNGVVYECKGNENLAFREIQHILDYEISGWTEKTSLKTIEKNAYGIKHTYYDFSVD